MAEKGHKTVLKQPLFGHLEASQIQMLKRRGFGQDYLRSGRIWQNWCKKGHLWTVLSVLAVLGILVRTGQK